MGSDAVNSQTAAGRKIHVTNTDNKVRNLNLHNLFLKLQSSTLLFVQQYTKFSATTSFQNKCADLTQLPLTNHIGGVFFDA